MPDLITCPFCGTFGFAPFPDGARVYQLHLINKHKFDQPSADATVLRATLRGGTGA